MSTSQKCAPINLAARWDVIKVYIKHYPQITKHFPTFACINLSRRTKKHIRQVSRFSMIFTSNPIARACPRTYGVPTVSQKFGVLRGFPRSVLPSNAMWSASQNGAIKQTLKFVLFLPPSMSSAANPAPHPRAPSFMFDASHVSISVQVTSPRISLGTPNTGQTVLRIWFSTSVCS